MGAVALVATVLPAAAAVAGPAPADSGSPTRYVATTGDDGGGANDCLTQATPCLTIGQAVTEATDGDTISVAAGTFGAFSTTKSVTVAGDPAGGTTISNPGSTAVAVLNGRGNPTPPPPDVDLRNLTISGSTTGVLARGGSVTLTHSTVTGNTGVGVTSMSPVNSLTIADSTIADNQGTGVQAAAGTLHITGSTIAGNATSSNAQGVSTSSVVTATTITDSTIADNGGNGLNLFGATTVTGSTISGNAAFGVNNQAAAGLVVTVAGSIIAGNAGNDCARVGNVGGDGGYNIAGDVSCAFTESSSQGSTDPQLRPALADNGGPTQTLAPSLGSPAVDAIPTSSALCTGTDQRGVSRPQGAQCDIGAVEQAAPTQLTVTTVSLKDATVGSAYSQTLAALAGTEPYSWSVTAGSLPDGLSLDASTGKISGTPSGAPGKSDFTVTVTDSAGTPATATADLSITVNAALAVTTTSLDDATVGSSYSQTLAASGGAEPYKWSLTSGTLPSGLQLDELNGKIIGVPTGAPGKRDFTVAVTDSASPSVSATADLSITVAPVPLAVTTTSLDDAAVDSSYSETLAASGGVTPYQWSVTTGSLPQGLSLDASTGKISGTPTAPGKSSFTVTATDSASPAVTATADLSITVAPAALAVTTSSLDDATVGAEYMATLAATGGVAPYSWSVTAGSLPEGLSLEASTGKISGTPSGAPGESDFTVTATDSAGTPVTATADLSITVAAAPVTTVASTTKLAVSPVSAAIGKARTVTATVTKSGGTPTGTVTFKAGGITKTAILSGGKATWALPRLAVGNHPVTASYSGDATTESSTATAVNVAVTKATSKVKAKAKKKGKKVRITITVKTVAGVSPKGKVTIKLKGKTKKTLHVRVNAKGKATITVKKLKHGKYKATVKYAGNSSVKGSKTTKKFKA